jgi:hypothetical protein
MKSVSATYRTIAGLLAAIISMISVWAQIDPTPLAPQMETPLGAIATGTPDQPPAPGGYVMPEIVDMRHAVSPQVMPRDLPRFFLPPNPNKKVYDPDKSSRGEAQEDPNAYSFEPAAPNAFRNWASSTRNNDIGGDIFVPPDPIITAGPNHIVAAVNDDIRIYDKNGTQLLAQDANTLFNTTDFLFDPKVAYDPWRNRFLILFMRRNTMTGTSFWSLAVSRTSDPTGQYWIYHLDARVFGNTDTNFWADYPQLGFDSNAVYITAIMFPNASGDAHPKMRCLNKDQIYNGQGAGWWDYRNLSSDGTYDNYLVPAQMWTYGDRTFIISAKSYAHDELALRILAWPTGSTWAQKWSNGPSLGSADTLDVSDYAIAPDGRQPSGVQNLDSINTRLLGATYHNLKLHTVQMVGYNWGSGNRAAIKYYRIGISSSSNDATVERDRIFGSSTHDYLYPAVTHTNEQDALFVFSRSNSSTFAEARYTGWRNSEAEFQGSALLQAGQATYLRLDSFNRNRWGDYSGAALDPTDQRTVWIIGEYARTNNQWGTWISEVNYKPLTTITAVNTSGTIGQIIAIQATARRADNNQPLADVTVQFRINGTLINTDQTDANGLAIIFYRLPESLGTGNKTITATMLGDGTYNGSTDTATLTVNKANTNFTLPAASGAIGQTVALTATLRRTPDSELLSGKTVTFKVNGTVIGTAVTNANGVATFNYAIPASLGVGNRTLSVEFAGDTLHNPSSANSTLTVNKANTAMIVDSVTGTIGQSVNLTATLRRTTDNVLLTGRTVTFKLNGLVIGTAVTNVSGVAILMWTVTNGSLGSNTLGAEFAGDTLYNASSSTANFKRMSETRVSVANVVGSRGMTVQLRAVLRLHPDGAMLPNRPVQFRVNGVIVGSTFTNASGAAEINYLIPTNAPCGVREIRVDYPGETNLHPSFGTANLTVRLRGDVNQDGTVDDIDLLMVLFAFGQSGSNMPEDLSGDGAVDDADLLEVLFNFGTTC